MRPPERFASLLGRACTSALNLYLCWFLTGCAAHRPPMATVPPPAETHLFLGDERTALQSCVGALRDAGFKVDEVDPDQGVIQGSLTTREPLGVVVHESEPLKKPVPGWQAGALFVAAAALVATGAVTLRQELGMDGDGPLINDRVDGALALIGLASSIKLAPAIKYEYRIAIQLLPMEGNTTQLRVVLDGTESQKGEGERTGPVRAPAFLTRFYAALDQSTHLDPKDQMQQALSTR